MFIDDIENISNLFYTQGDLISQYSEFDQDEISLRSCTIKYSSKEVILNEFHQNTLRINNSFVNLDFCLLLDYKEINESIINMVGNSIYLNGVYNNRKNNIFDNDFNYLREQLTLFNKKLKDFNYIDIQTASEIWINKMIKSCDELFK